MVNTAITVFAVLLYANAAFGLNILTKSDWGGRAAMNATALENGLSYAIIHHTAGNYCSSKDACITQVKNIQSYHMDTNRWDDIGYNFLIGGDGNVYEGRGWNVVGAHASNWNARSIGIAFLGNYNTNTLTSEQISICKSLLAEGVSRGQLISEYILYGYRQIGSTESPGANVYNEIKTWSNWKAA